MKNELRCIAIRQPWAFLACCGKLAIENRTWSTKHRGDIAIHAPVYRGVTDKIRDQRIDKCLFDYGAIIGVVELFDAVRPSEISDNDFAKGPWCLLFRNARLLKSPVKHKARVGLCKLPKEVAERVIENLSNCVDVVNQKKIQDTSSVILKEIADVRPWKRTSGSRPMGW